MSPMVLLGMVLVTSVSMASAVSDWFGAVVRLGWVAWLDVEEGVDCEVNDVGVVVVIKMEGMSESVICGDWGAS